MNIKPKMSLILALTLTIVPASSRGATAAEEHRYVSEAVLTGRDFPLLSAIHQDPKVSGILSQDPQLAGYAKERWAVIKRANQDCKEDLHCKASAAKFTTDQIDQVSRSLKALYEKNADLKQFVQEELDNNPEYSINSSKRGAELLIDNWSRSAAAMNAIIATYCEGAKPRYGEIDSVTYKADSQSYSHLMRIILDGLPLAEAVGEDRHSALFFEPSLRFAVRLLQANSRDEAGRFWPLESGENRPAVEYSKTVKWSGFPYSLSLVPGAGNEVTGVSISPWGRERLRLAVDAFKSGKAPFIMLSGGYVHPAQTPYCEAIEMKRYLIEVYGVSERAILVEPHARHTTTNLRNAVRQIVAYKMPEQKPMLIVSDAAQSSYITSEVFEKRNIEELGYQPAPLGKRLSVTEVEAMPSRQSLYRNALDPLDP